MVCLMLKALRFNLYKIKNVSCANAGTCVGKEEEEEA
jgi:hypothetical protein